MFNAVEGNSTFYGLPSLETAQRWCDQSTDGFRFSLKFPRAISHEHQLVGCHEQLESFLEIVEVLRSADRLGPTFLQLGPSFGPDQFFQLEHFLHQLPPGPAWAVEVRHAGWFDQAENENKLNEMLRRRGVDKVLFDSRALFQSPPDDEIEAVSQQRKPKTPVRQTVTGRHPMLRFVGRNRLDLAEPYIAQWSKIVAGWVAEGLQPYVFTHAPDDQHAPEFARRFWNQLCNQLDGQNDPDKSSDEAAKPADMSRESKPSYQSTREKRWSPEDLPNLAKPPEQLSFFEGD